MRGNGRIVRQPVKQAGIKRKRKKKNPKKPRGVEAAHLPLGVTPVAAGLSSLWIFGTSSPRATYRKPGQ